MIKHELVSPRILDAEGYAWTMVGSGFIGIIALIPAFGITFVEGMPFPGLLFFLPLLFAFLMFAVNWTHAMAAASEKQTEAYNKYHDLSKDLKARIGKLTPDFFMAMESHEVNGFIKRINNLVRAENASIRSAKRNDVRVIETFEAIESETKILEDTTEYVRELR